MNKEEIMNKIQLYEFCENIEELYDDYYVPLQQENKQLKEEIAKADSITQSCIFNGKRESEISYRKCLNMIAELKEELKEEKRINVEDLKTIDRQQEIIQELREKINKYEKIVYICNRSLDKMQELENGDNNENI